MVIAHITSLLTMRKRRIDAASTPISEINGPNWAHKQAAEAIEVWRAAGLSNAQILEVLGVAALVEPCAAYTLKRVTQAVLDLKKAYPVIPDGASVSEEEEGESRPDPGETDQAGPLLGARDPPGGKEGKPCHGTTPLDTNPIADDLRGGDRRVPLAS